MFDSYVVDAAAASAPLAPEPLLHVRLAEPFR